jgi:hypothetical protein
MKTVNATTLEAGLREHPNLIGCIVCDTGIFSGGAVGWFKNGKAHKEDGPAITYDSPLLHDVWCLNGISYPKNQWQEEIVKIKMRRILDS